MGIKGLGLGSFWERVLCLILVGWNLVLVLLEGGIGLLWRLISSLSRKVLVDIQIYHLPHQQLSLSLERKEKNPPIPTQNTLLLRTPTKTKTDRPLNHFIIFSFIFLHGQFGL